MDINGDGHPDILSGSYSRMEQAMAGLFQVLYGNADGTFKKAEVLKGTDGEPLIIPIKGQEQQRLRAACALAAAQLGLPMEPILVLLGVDHIMDMGRTSVNVIGNCLAKRRCSRTRSGSSPRAR